MAEDVSIMSQIDFSVWQYSWNSLHHLLWLIMFISWCYWKPGYLVWCLLSFGYQNAFDAANIRFSVESRKNVCYEKTRCSGLQFRMFWFVADAQYLNLFCWTKFSKIRCSGIKNRRVRYFQRFERFRQNNDDRTYGLKNTPGMLFIEPWSCYWYKSSMANFEVCFSWSWPLSLNYRWFAIEMLGFGLI
jgi:hypothetical protein